MPKKRRSLREEATAVRRARLPTYEPLASRFREAFEFYLRAITHSEGISGQVPVTTIHEGRRTVVIRAGEAPDETEMKAISTEITLDFKTIENINLGVIGAKLREMAEQFRDQQSKHFIELMHEVTEKTGQVIKRNEPLSHEGMLEALRMMPPSFDPLTGQSNISIVIHPDQLDHVQRLDAEYRANDALQRQVAELEARKRDEYRTEEMARSVVG